MPLYGNVSGLGPRPIITVNDLAANVKITVEVPEITVAITVSCD